MRSCACTCPHICWPWCKYRVLGQSDMKHKLEARAKPLQDDRGPDHEQRRTVACGRWFTKCGCATMNFLMGLFQRGSYYIPHDEDFCISRKSMEQSALRSLSIDHLEDADDAIVGAVTFANSAAVDKRMSKSSDSLSAGLSQRRSRSTSVGEKDADSAYEEGSSSRTRSKSELENEVRKLMQQLHMERKQKEDMQNRITLLQTERQRLQTESTTAAVQLQQFKEWIYQGDKTINQSSN